MATEFYSTLFSIEVTLLGIIAASTFVLIQMLHTSFSYKEMLLPLKRGGLFAFYLVSVLLVLFTGVGLLHHSMGSHDFLTRWNLHSIEIFSSNYVLTGIFISFVISIILGIYAIYEAIKLLNPPTLIKKHLDAMDVQSVENFLYMRYGVVEPVEPILSQIKFVGTDGEEEVKDMVNKEEAQKKYEKQLVQYESAKLKASKGNDVFQSFENLFINSIAKGDRSTVQQSISDYEEKIIDIINKSESHFPYKYLAQYLGESLNVYIEACRKHDQSTLALGLIRSTKSTVITLSKKTSSNEVKELLKTLKESADLAIKTENRLLFKEIIKSYEAIGDSAFEKEDHKQDGYSNLIDEVFRHLGWLAERLITSKGIEEKPMMHDEDYEDEFGILYNTLFHFDFKYSYDYADAYPLIFFDAVHVLYDRMLDYYTSLDEDEINRQSLRPEIKDWLFSCGYVFASFARHALEKGNGDGVSLAAMRLRQVYRSAENTKNYELAKDFIESITNLAVRCASTDKDLKGKTLGSTNVVENLEEIILKSPFKREIESAVFESYIKVDSSESRKKIAYIKSLGKKLNTNFGLNFDSLSGEDLS